MRIAIFRIEVIEQIIFSIFSLARACREKRNGFVGVRVRSRVRSVADFYIELTEK